MIHGPWFIGLVPGVLYLSHHESPMTETHKDVRFKEIQYSSIDISISCYDTLKATAEYSVCVQVGLLPLFSLLAHQISNNHVG
jgi:hypothetical protein